MSRVTRRPLAATDILDIWDHIAEDSIEQADRWVDKLDEKFKLIATQPLMGRARDELAADLRSFPFGRYVIFYEPIEDGIDVVRVLHSARDIDAAFGEATFSNSAGDELVFGLNANGVAPDIVFKRAAQTSTSTAQGNLEVAALLYWLEHDLFDQMAANETKVLTMRMPSVIQTAMPLTARYFFGVARSASYQSVSGDAQRVLTAAAGRDESARRQHLLATGLQGSAIEGSVLDQLYTRPEETSVSTTQYLAIAMRQGLKLFSVTSENINAVLPQLATSQAVKDDIINAVAAGMVPLARRLDDGAWFVKLTAEPLDVMRPDHVEALAWAYWRFDKVGKRMTQTTIANKVRKGGHDKKATGDRTKRFALRERDVNGQWWDSAAEPITADSAANALKIYFARNAYGRKPKANESLRKLADAYDEVAAEVGLTRAADIEAVEFHV